MRRVISKTYMYYASGPDNGLPSSTRVGVGNRGAGSMCPPKIREKFFGQFLRKIRAFFSGKSHVKFGDFVKFSGKYHKNSGTMIIFRAKIM